MRFVWLNEWLNSQCNYAKISYESYLKSTPSILYVKYRSNDIDLQWYWFICVLKQKPRYKANEWPWKWSQGIPSLIIATADTPRRKIIKESNGFINSLFNPHAIFIREKVKNRFFSLSHNRYPNIADKLSINLYVRPSLTSG